MSKSKSKLKSHSEITQFCLDGKVVHVFFDGSKPKCLQLVSASGLHLIKLSKECRSSCEQLMPGTIVRVVGYRKQKYKNGQLKLKAEQVTVIENIQYTELPEDVSTPENSSNKTKSKKSAKILVCKKSDCRKRGGPAICAALRAELEQRGLQDEVEIKETGCLKRCKAGPNIVMMPDKAPYSRVRPNAVAELVEQHF
ncbi:MAG: (2Fe-2S) ferredoxin domain-containing protein [Microcoleaceae cyanobacterium]